MPLQGWILLLWTLTLKSQGLLPHGKSLMAFSRRWNAQMFPECDGLGKRITSHFGAKMGQKWGNFGAKKG